MAIGGNDLSANPGWTVERVEALRSMWADGMSAGEIGKELGVSRGGICGKAWRLGLPPHLSTTQMDQRRKSRQATKMRMNGGQFSISVSRTHAVRAAPSIVAEALSTPADDLAIPADQRKTLMQLGDRDCRWPVGDTHASDFFFCAAPAEAGKPYCGPHCRRAFTAPPSRTGAVFRMNGMNGSAR